VRYGAKNGSCFELGMATEPGQRRSTLHVTIQTGPLRELGELVGGMQYPAVTMASRRFSERLPRDKILEKKVKRLATMLLVKT
jgi:hypothetical protein